MIHVERRVVRATSTLRQQVVEGIRGAITDLTFRPGERLIERELCEMLDVSRTLVREALSQLAAEGLVQIIPHKGPIVRVISLDEARGLYEVRATLEGMAARLFAERATDTQRSQLTASLEALRVVDGDDAVLRFLKAKADLYTILLDGTANPILNEMLRLIHTRVTLLRATTLSQPGRLASSFKEVKKMVRAIQARDGDAAARAAAEHVHQAELLASKVLSQAAAAQASGDERRLQTA